MMINLLTELDWKSSCLN